MSNNDVRSVEPLEPSLMNPVIALRLGALFAGLGVVLGTFGTEWLHSRVAQGLVVPEMLDDFRIGVQYQFIHAIAMVAIACGGSLIWQLHFARWAIIAWSAGIVLFSGSLYVIALTGITGLHAITPFGGVAFIIGWGLVCLGARMNPRTTPGT